MIKYFILAFIFLPTMLFSQQKNSILADLTQDVALMRREIGQLRLEIEELRRENVSLKSSLSGNVSSDLVISQNAVIKSEFDAKLEALKSEIAITLKKELDSMANQTNIAIKQVASSIQEREAKINNSPKVFSDNYPQRGIKYIVQRGDNLSKIAKTFNSKVKWIQDANQIDDPTNIQIGQELAIPQN